jgi:hypothetical protein
MHLSNISNMNTAVEERFIRQAKRLKRCVSPDREDEFSSIGCAEEYLSECDHDSNTDENNHAMHEAEQKLCENILSLLEEVEEESLVKQSRIRTNLKQKHNSNTSCGQALANEKLKSGISKVLILILQSPTLLGRHGKERYKSLSLIECLVKEDWDIEIVDFVEEIRAVLRCTFDFPPRFIFLPDTSSCESAAAASAPKQLCFDLQLRRNKLTEKSRSVLASLSKHTQDLLQKRLESLGDEDNLPTTPLETIEGIRDILCLWTEMVEKFSPAAELDDQALELYEDALLKARSTSIDSMLWNFVFYLSLQEGSRSLMLYP